ncbi:MAG: hypothetical protein EB127_03920 [Alphaproteobacteria bacterium]|nr:hypothetical protein [Alphaproteobacteria bacterium]
MIERKFDLKSIILDIVASKTTDSSSYMLSNIKTNLDNFVQSEWDNVVVIPSLDARQRYYRNDKLPIPYFNEDNGELLVSREEATRRIGLQYITVSKNNIPNDSTIAFGSAYYSNDEQKAFALKYDCSIAKSPSKTQYYVLSKLEEIALHHIVKYPANMMKPRPVKAIVATPKAIKASLEQFIEINAPTFKTEIVKAIANGRYLTAEQAVDRGTHKHSFYEGILEAYKFGYLGNAYVSPYSDLKVQDVQGRGRILTSPHFEFDWGWSNRLLKGISVHGKNSATLFDVPMLYMHALSDAEIEGINNGGSVVIPVPSFNEWQARWERKTAGSYYGNSFHISNGSLGNTTLPGRFTVDTSDPSQYEIINTDRYITLDSHFNSLDRLFGFLTENPDITVVSETVFVSQLKASNPTLNLTTYDSLYGMFRSEDQNTRKTAIKMLQSFDLPEATNGSYRDSEDPKYYAFDLAIDLVANANVTGASINKWLVKKTGSNLSSIIRQYARTRGYGGNPYTYNAGNYGRTFCGFDGKDPHPAMPYDDRSKYNAIQYDIQSLVPQFFEEQTKSMPKYYPIYRFKTSILNNKVFDAFKKMYTDLIGREDSLTDNEKTNLGYLQLFMRHYVEYTFSRYYLGQSLAIAYDLNIKSSSDIPAVADAKLMNSLFGEYKKKFIQAKAKALANPVKYMDILAENEMNYRTKYIHNLNGYRSDSIPDYANQAFLLGLPHNIMTTNQDTYAVPHTDVMQVFDYYIANL